MTATKEYLNPDSLHSSPAFSQAIAVSGPARTIYIGGQNGVGPDGLVVGPTLGEQTRQILRNVRVILDEAGATPDDAVRRDRQGPRRPGSGRRDRRARGRLTGLELSTARSHPPWRASHTGIPAVARG